MEKPRGNVKSFDDMEALKKYISDLIDENEKLRQELKRYKHGKRNGPVREEEKL